METMMFIAVAVLTLFVIVCFILCMINMSKINELNDLADEGGLGETVMEYYAKVEELADKIKITTDESIISEVNKNRNQIALTLKKIGVVHFDAYDDVTGQFSFSAAILNELNTGIILTSLYGHNSCNTYIREVENGKAKTFLLEEEKQALEKAAAGQ